MTTQVENRIRLNLVRQVDDSYDVVVGTNLFSQIAQELKRDFPKISKFAIITDSTVGPLYAPVLENQLEEHGLVCNTLEFKAGEENKNIDTVKSLLNRLGHLKYNRDSLILALGGGVVGDTAGLVATLLNRGVTYVQVPTSTLAQADSAIGGKTGVDLDAGKNLAGVIRQPNRVYMDVSTLRTLDDRNFRAGLVETIKHGIIRDARFFEFLEQNLDDLLERDEDYLTYVALENSKIKGGVVEIDPNEQGLRRILNYGHTLGHAIETASRYALLHGEAVSLGMRAAGLISCDANIFPSSDLARQNNLLNRLGMPRKIPANITNEEILAITLSDKKAQNGQVNYCLPEKIGVMREYGGKYTIPVDKTVVEKVLNSLRCE